MKKDRGKISVGTVFMLSLIAVVLTGSLLVMARLSSGVSIDLSRLRLGAVKLNERYDGPKEQAGTGKTDQSDAAGSGQPAEKAAAKSGNDAQKPANGSCTVTFSGVVAMEGEVRKNSYLSEVKKYDFIDILQLEKELRSDLNVAFLENVLSDNARATDTVAPRDVAGMLGAPGFNMVACGFARAYGLEATGILSTRNALRELGMTPLGVLDEDGERIRIVEAGGVRLALMQYTDTIPAATRKTMVKKEQSGMVPEADPEQIAADIAAARGKGAQAVIVLMNWGKVGKTADKAQKTLAQQIADAGADLIVGNGSRIVQGMEMLTAAESGRQVPCYWSLGTVLSGSRSTSSRLSGMLVHVTVSVRNGADAEIREMQYTPLYTWKYKQDGRYYYQCIPSNKTMLGMDAEQQKIMEKSLNIVREAMRNTGVEERPGE